MSLLRDYINEQFNIDTDVINFCSEIESSLKEQFDNIDKTTEYNQLKVLNAMRKNKVSDVHFASTTGYGYNDLGRDVLESVYSDVFNAEASLVRPQIISGTHALTVALFGNLRPGDEMLSPVGKPYDTLEGVIKNNEGSLADFGIIYKQVELLDDGKNEIFDFDAIKNAITSKTKLVTIQRSKGYNWRVSLSLEQIKQLIKFIKNIDENIICMVDNCYGEFVSHIEPSDIGADLVVGSLIKNPGGGLAPVGGYIVGRKKYVDCAAYRLSAPGLGKEVGPTLGLTSVFMQGLFLAPQVVAASLKGAIFASKIFNHLGFETLPNYNENRSDIVQAIKLNASTNVIAFCQGIQKSSPVDSFVLPEPAYMPGYSNNVIMASGAFVSGSSIELSADAPMREPYIVFMQGGLSWHHAKIGVMSALQSMINNGCLVNHPTPCGVG